MPVVLCVCALLAVLLGWFAFKWNRARRLSANLDAWRRSLSANLTEAKQARSEAEGRAKRLAAENAVLAKERDTYKQRLGKVQKAYLELSRTQSRPAAGPAGGGVGQRAGEQAQGTATLESPGRGPEGAAEPEAPPRAEPPSVEPRPSVATPADHEAALHETETEVDLLPRQPERADTENAELRGERTAMLNQLFGWKSRYQNLERQYQELDGRLRRLEEALRAQEADANEAKAQLSEARSQLAQKDSQVEEIEKKLEKKDADVRRLTEQVDAAQRDRVGELRAAEARFEAALRTRDQEAAAECERLKQEHASHVRQVETRCENVRLAGELRLAHMWPQAFVNSGLQALQATVTEGLTSEPPVPEAMVLFGAIQQVCARVDSDRTRDHAFELGRAFYGWSQKTGGVNPALEQGLSAWLGKLLEESKTRVVAVRPGEPVSARLHSPEGRGHVVKQALSFLFLRDDGTPYKRALVST